jgi:hypothetical protein
LECRPNRVHLYCFFFFLFRLFFFLICFLIILSVCLLFFLPFLSLSSSYLLSFLFQKYLWSFVDFFFLLSRLVQYQPQSGHTHILTLSLSLYLKK